MKFKLYVYFLTSWSRLFQRVRLCVEDGMAGVSEDLRKMLVKYLDWIGVRGASSSGDRFLLWVSYS